MTKYWSKNQIIQSSDLKPFFHIEAIFWKIVALNEIKVTQIGRNLCFDDNGAKIIIAELNKYSKYSAFYPKKRKDFIK